MKFARKRIQYLDGLRGIAAVSVVLQHAAEKIMTVDPTSAPVLQPAFIDFFNAGRFGVALFFLISGFVIPFSFKQPRPLGGFAISRVFRLYPAYWLSLALAIVVLPPLTGASYSITRMLANITMVQAVLGQPDVLGPYWTLVIELAFYFLCAGLFATRLLANGRALIVAVLACQGLALAVAAYASLRGGHLPANILVNISLMFLGTLMRRGWLEHDTAAQRWLTPVIITWAGVLPPILWLTPAQPDIPVTPLSFCAAYWIALGFFIAASRLDWLKSRYFIALGAASYSLYLFHPICTVIVSALVPPANLWLAVAFTCGSLVFSIAMAALVYRVIERPAIRAGHRLADAAAR
jgi:peptidoglycan/LPS O-acetylase OafA/YrhL